MKYYLYIDESGNGFSCKAREPSFSYTGCIVESGYDRNVFQPSFEYLKNEFFAHDPVDKEKLVVFHRNEIINRKGAFSCLSDSETNRRFERALLERFQSHEYALVTTVIDTVAYSELNGERAPFLYRCCLLSLLEQYCWFLTERNARGDVVIEAIGKKQDKLLNESFKQFYEQGTNSVSAKLVQSSLISALPLLRQKPDNIVGLQVADLLAHPCKQGILAYHKVIPEAGDTFGKKIWSSVQQKYLCGGQIFIKPGA